MSQVQILHFSDLHFLLDYEKDSLVQTMKKKTGKDSTDQLMAFMKEIKDHYDYIDFAVLTGDITTGGSIACYEEIKRLLEANFEFPIYYCMGNHDSRKNFRQVFLNEENGSESPYFYGMTDEKTGIEILALDNSYTKGRTGQINSEQFQWLEEKLKQPWEKGRILLMHMPPVLPKFFHEFSLADESQRRLFEIIRHSDISMILSGHVHMNLYCNINGISSYTASSIAFGLGIENDQLRPCNSTGYNLYIKQANEQSFFASAYSLADVLNRVYY